jgi:hypothetical protein
VYAARAHRNDHHGCLNDYHGYAHGNARGCDRVSADGGGRGVDDYQTFRISNMLYNDQI